MIEFVARYQVKTRRLNITKSPRLAAWMASGVSWTARLSGRTRCAAKARRSGATIPVRAAAGRNSRNVAAAPRTAPRRPPPRKRMIRAFLFDLDGTLLDTEKLWVQATRAWLLDRGVPCTPEQATKLVYGHSWHDIYTQLAARHPQLAVGETQAGLDLRPFFAKMRQPGHVIIASSVALLKQLAAQHPVAIVSGSPRADVADGIALMAWAHTCDSFLAPRITARASRIQPVSDGGATARRAAVAMPRLRGFFRRCARRQVRRHDVRRARTRGRACAGCFTGRPRAGRSGGI